ncbi:MAG: Gfo/Idh/MocA family oxidoreductase [Caldicoprobacterales bacterium]|jgi:predicted dehydrogenase|nr:Gfo/Idh/MocA family oxidoreductase [Clostridiales bacterium]
MLKVGLVGIGFMGRGHLDIYMQLEEEGYPVKLVAICDIDKDKFEGKFLPGNLNVGNLKYDFSKYNLYTDYDEMLEKEDLDYVDIALPTYLHAEATIKALNKGIHVLCEKPMALNTEECQAMIDAAKANNKKLMIAQCLRFWPEYEYLKKCVDSKEYGNVVSAYFFRGGTTPKWSYENWLLNKDKSGGVLLDQHIHDVDAINWLFGTPKMVTTVGRNVFPGSGYDAVSTNYIYDDKVINAQDDWTINSSDFGFAMTFRVNFEKGTLIYEGGKLTVYPHDGEAFVPEMEEGSGYYREIKYFTQAIMNDTPIEVADVYSTMETIRIANAEQESADQQAKLIEL